MLSRSLHLTFHYTAAFQQVALAQRTRTAATTNASAGLSTLAAARTKSLPMVGVLFLKRDILGVWISAQQDNENDGDDRYMVRRSVFA